jgi:hypothetical protein
MVIETTVLIVVTNTLADLIRARVDPARALSRVAREAWAWGVRRRVPNAFPSEAVPSVSFVRAKGGSLIRARESRPAG